MYFSDELSRSDCNGSALISAYRWRNIRALIYELEELMNKRYAQNSERKVWWAVKTNSQWRLHSMEMDNCDPRIFCSDVHDVKTLDKGSFAFALCKFITEVIKVNGEEYPPNMLKELVYCIQMYLHFRRVFFSSH